MDPFTADYLANLTADLTAGVLSGAGRRLGQALAGSEEQQALRRCVQAGVVALLTTMDLDAPAEREHVAGLFREFLADADVYQALSVLLRGIPLDVDELAYLFEDAGYVAGDLPGLDFRQGMAAFEAAFIAAAAEEPALQDTLQTGQLLAQTRLQRDLLAAMRELAAFLRQARPGSVGIEAGRIVAQNVVSGVQIVYHVHPVEPVQETPDWESHYLRTLIARCDPLDLAPIDPLHPVDAKPVRISDVFTTLYLAQVRRLPEQPVADAILRPHAEELVRAQRQERDKEKEPVPVQAVEAVAALPRLVILGAPGGGKSTLVNHVATQLARRRLGQDVGADMLPGWAADDRRLPVRVVLRRFAAWLPAGLAHGDAGHVWAYLHYELERWGCREACDGLERVLKDEGGVVFFDGLDEVRHGDEVTKRTVIKEAITAFAAPLDQCTVVVTCREYAYRRGDAWHLPEAEFPVVELALFDLEQVEAFTRTWYRVVGPSKGWAADKCDAEARHLYEAVGAWPHLRELAQYPLLLTLMAQVHGRDGTLPEDRADLYERAVDLLLAQWEGRIVRDVDGERSVEPGLVPRLGVRTETLCAALERVAFDAHERQEQAADRGERAADVPREDLRDALAAGLGSVDRADVVIAYVQERAGLLQARDNRTYAFPHRTFQEYLAARHVLKQGEPDALLRDLVRRDQAWWQEVFLLAAGASRGTPSIIANLGDCLVPLLPEKGDVPAAQVERARLAGQALAQTGFVEHAQKEEEPGRFTATYQRVQSWLVAGTRADATVAARERAGCGDVLARLGDPRPGVGLRPDGLPDIAWCRVPAGPFVMGSDKARDPQAFGSESPQHEVVLPEFGIGKYPVTNAQYAAFVAGGGYGERRFWTGAGWQWKGDRTTPGTYGGVFDLANHPVVMVTWYEAVAFCRWLTEQLRERGKIGQRVEVRLPTEAEWEKAARATDGRIYPWGNEFDAGKCNMDNTGIGTTSAVGCFPGGASPYGAEEMSGNVWEWCQSLYREYPYNPEDGREKLDDNGIRVVRGGAFYNYQGDARCAFRDSWNVPGSRNSYVSFRCVVAPVPSAI